MCLLFVVIVRVLHIDTEKLRKTRLHVINLTVSGLLVVAFNACFEASRNQKVNQASREW